VTAPWLPPRASPSAERLLICLPPAGGGALAYLAWRREFAPQVEVLPALLPGRDDRKDEQPVSDVGALVTDLAAAVAGQAAQPFALYGHSMGALLAFELAHALTELGQVPVCLVVSGCDAPHRHQPAHGPDETDEELTGLLLGLGGTDPEIVGYPELLGAAIGTLRADLALEQGYRFRPRPLLSAPVTAVAGTDDPYVTRDGLAAWSELTRGHARVEQVPSGHFLRGAGQRKLLAIIRQEIAAPTSDDHPVRGRRGP
jgi:medium-chain acyl-[acyl-carrier-protein] hydrolase